MSPLAHWFGMVREHISSREKYLTFLVKARENPVIWGSSGKVQKPSTLVPAQANQTKKSPIRESDREKGYLSEVRSVSFFFSEKKGDNSQNR